MADPEPAPAPPRGVARAIVAAAGIGRIGIVVETAEPAGPHVRYASETALALLGYGADELQQMKLSLRLPDDQTPRILQWKNRGSEAMAPVIDAELTKKDGTRVPVRLAASDTDLDGRRATVQFFFDTADRRLAETALRAAESRFRALIEAAPDGIAIGTRAGLAYANSALLRLLGVRTIEEMRALALSDRVHPEDAPRMIERIRALLRGNAPQPPFELRMRHRDGHWIRVEIVDMLTEWDGTPAVLGIARDLSERRQLQSELIQADRLTAVGTLAAGVAHEINNPLAYVLLNLQYLQREVPRLGAGALPLERLMERLAEAQHGAERVGTIVRDLRAFSRTDTESLGPVELERVLSSALRVAGGHLSGRARVIEDYADVLPVRGDAARLEQVFLNLLVNAAQALPEGRADENQVRVSLRQPDESRVVVEIFDTGAGIPPELLDRVFDPFFTTKPAGVGTGLGLPICHAIVTSFGGDISVESKVGHGTVFRVSLPVEIVPESGSTDRATQPPTSLVAAARVLIVDDELPVASMLSRVLGDEHEVRVATSAREALDLLLGGEPFDVVLCDLLMPGMSGMDLFQQLAERQPGSEQRLVFMTGGAFTPRAADFLAAVPNMRLEKPFDLREVRRLVRDLARAGRAS